MRRVEALCLGLVVFMMSCSASPTGPTAELVTSFSQPTWISGGGGREAEATLTIVNTSQSDAFVARCADRVWLGVDRRSGTGWQHYGYACLTVYDMSPFVVAPGQTRVQAVRFTAAGSYRVSFGVYRAQQCEGDPGSTCL